MSGANHLIIVAGATGNLGSHIARELKQRGADVRAIVRPGADTTKVAKLRESGVEVVQADYGNRTEMARACDGGTCVVSALAGLRDVIIDAQAALLEGAVKARVPRFIPSDFSLDFTKTRPGTNRNLDLRREFHSRLFNAPIAATSILNGMFADLLQHIVISKIHRVVCWENKDQMLDFTTIPDVAAFTARAAMDSDTPRILRIAGDEITPNGLAEVASEVTGEKYKAFKAGGLGRLHFLIGVMKKMKPGVHELYPPWQTMQYVHNMYTGHGKLDPIDNDRYPDMKWTGAREVLGGLLA